MIIYIVQLKVGERVLLNLHLIETSLITMFEIQQYG